MKFRPIFSAAVLLLAACNNTDTGAEGERKTAAGQVLGGSISDAMLPLDTVTSQNPPLADAAAAGDAAATDAPAKSKGRKPAATGEPAAQATAAAEN